MASLKRLKTVVDLTSTLGILDELNRTGRCLFINDKEFIDSSVDLVSSCINLYEKVDVLMTILGLDDIVDNDAVFTEKLKALLYQALKHMHDSLKGHALLSDEFMISYVNRLHENNIVFRVTYHE